VKYLLVVLVICTLGEISHAKGFFEQLSDIGAQASRIERTQEDVKAGKGKIFSGMYMEKITLNIGRRTQEFFKLGSSTIATERLIKAVLKEPSSRSEDFFSFFSNTGLRTNDAKGFLQEYGFKQVKAYNHGRWIVLDLK